MGQAFDAVLAERARDAPGAVAIVDANCQLTYGELEARVEGVSGALAALDLGSLDRSGAPRVVLVAENSAAHLATAFAIWRAGATLVTVYPSSSAAELEYALAHSRPALVIAGESVLPTVRPVAATLALPLLTLAATGEIGGFPGAQPGPCPETDRDGLALICYTSGSTARPKAVMHSHGGLLAAARAYAAVWHLSPADVNLVSMPLAWAFGLVTTSMATLTAGGRVVLFARSDPRALLTGFDDHGATFFAGVTTMFVRMVEAMESDPHTPRPSRLRLCISGGEPRNEAAFTRWHTFTGCPVHDVYAASECFPVVTYDPTVDVSPKPGRAGRVVPEASMRVVDPDGRDVPPGEAGEAWVRGPALMLGYWDDPTLTRAVLNTDGWYVTGDLVEVEPDGYVRVLGRLSDVIIRAGANVSPAEVEAVLVRHPDVGEAGVVGLPDPVNGEEVVAAVVPQRGIDSIDIGALDAHSAGRVGELQATSHRRRRRPAAQRQHRQDRSSSIEVTSGGGGRHALGRPMKTALTARFGIEHPVMSAGMARVAQAPLVAAVSEAGGMGCLGGVSYLADALHDEIHAIRALTAAPFAVNLLVPPSLLDDSVEDWEPVRQRWEHLRVEERDKLRGVEPMLTPGAVAHQVEVVLAEQPAAVVLTFDAPAWFVTECHERGIAVFCLVGSVSRAAQAEMAGADFIVAQGTEGGGHTGYISTMVLVPAVVDAVHVPVLAAGGIVDGRGLAAARCLGAHGVWMGTRFVASTEAYGHQAYKQRVVDAGSKHTTLSRAYTGKPLRTFRNRWTDQWEGRGDEIAAFPEQYAVAGVRVESGYQDGDVDEGMMPAGQGVEVVHAILPAGEIVRRVVADAEAILAGLAADR